MTRSIKPNDCIVNILIEQNLFEVLGFVIVIYQMMLGVNAVSFHSQYSMLLLQLSLKTEYILANINVYVSMHTVRIMSSTFIMFHYL
jgi:hypothetical protein